MAQTEVTALLPRPVGTAGKQSKDRVARAGQWRAQVASAVIHAACAREAQVCLEGRR